MKKVFRIRKKKRIIHISNLFWNSGCYFHISGGWNNSTNLKQTYKVLYKFTLLNFFHFFTRMNKQAKFSPRKRMFVCQHKMTWDHEPVIQFVHHILHGGHGEGKLPNFHYKFASDVLEDVSSHLVLAIRRKFSLLPPSQDKSGTWNDVQFAKNVQS